MIRCKAQQGTKDKPEAYLRGGIDSELQLALLAVVERETLHHEGRETRTCAAAERMEDKEALRRKGIGE